MIAVPNEWFWATSADIALGPSSSMLLTITSGEPESVRHTVPLSATRFGMVRNVRFSYEKSAYGLGGGVINCGLPTAAAFSLFRRSRTCRGVKSCWFGRWIGMSADAETTRPADLFR
jgi:hypothetical protein